MIRLSNWVRFLACVTLVFIVDRVTKIMAVNMLSEASSVAVFPRIFNLTLVNNTGSAFGLLKDQRLFFIFVTIITVIFIAFYIWKQKTLDVVLLLSFGLIAGGAIGNLFDRITCGYVVDFLDFRIWPVFNMADSAITVGAAILILRMIIARVDPGK